MGFRSDRTVGPQSRRTATAARETAQRRAVVDVVEGGGKPERNLPRQVAQHIGQRLGPRPAHRAEGRRQARRAAHPDQPEPAVVCRAEHQIVAAEQAERVGDVARRDGGDVGPDQHRRPRRTRRQRPPHADAQIAAALRRDRDAARPQPGARAGARRGHREPQAPAPVAAEPAIEAPEHRPLEAQGGEVADIGGEAALADPVLRRAHKQHEVAPAHPYSRAMWRGGRPAK
jgi:hypothetical protein